MRRRALDVVGTRAAAAIVFLLAVGVWWLQAVVMPLEAGRDFGTYLGAYAQLFHSHPIDLGYLLGRTPLAPLLAGALLDFRGGVLAEPVMSLLYATSILAWFLTARTFSRRAALLVVAVLLAYPGYGILFHELSSDSVFAAAFALWSLLVVRVLRAPTPLRFAYVGAGLGVLVLIRPGNQVLLVLVLVPLLLDATWRTRVMSAATFLVAALVLIGGWALHNGLRYGDYVVARGGNQTVPFYRAFVTDRIVRPENGSASRELANAVRTRLLPREPYRSYGITLQRFFEDASPRMQEDLVALSDRVKGWDTNQRWLRDVGVEAVRTHKWAYTRGVVRSTWGMLRQGLYRSPPSVPAAKRARGTPPATKGALPTPSEGEPIPAAHEGGVSTRDGSIYTVWTSPTEHHLVFVHPGDAARYRALHGRMDELAANLPDRKGNRTLTHRFNQASRWFPPPVFWLLVGCLGLIYRRRRPELPVVVPVVSALVVIVLSALGLPAEPHYSMPLAPAFVLFGAAGLFAGRRERVREWTTLRRWLAPAAGLAAALWALQIYVSKVRGSFSAGQAPHDLDVFLRAAGNVVHGVSPYVYRGDATYAYPPLLAFLVAPLHPLSAGVATLFWTIVSLAAIAGALWLLGLRDWRCYALVAVYPITRSAVGLGTIGPLLLLALAAAWNWRDRLFEPAAATGAAVALKLFLWPLLLWLALTRRIRAALLAGAFTLAFVLLPWALLGFAGLGRYPHLLRRLADDEATSSYSIVALTVRLHLPEVVGSVVSLVVAAALIAAAVWVARDSRRGARERDIATLTLLLAAALAASPIVWIHYFLVLLVPLALTRPQLSWLWFVPLAYYPLGETAWPAGDAGKLAIALITTLVLLGATLWRVLLAEEPLCQTRPRAPERRLPARARAAR